MTSTMPASGALDLEDQAALVRAWAETAEDVDALGLAAHLLAADPDPDDALRARWARLLLVAGRPQEALAVLPATERGPLVRERPRGWHDVVALACHAALGDADALGALLRFGSTLPTSQARTLADLLAAAASAAGRTDLADDAAHGAPARPTPFSVRRRVVARLHQRGVDPELVAARVLDCAHALLEVHPAADEDPSVAADVLRDLRDRDDPHAATLLAEALVALRPESAGLAALRRTHRAGRRAPRATGLVAAFFAACATVLTVASATGRPLIAFAGLPAVALAARVLVPAGPSTMGEWDARALRSVRRQLRAFPDAGSRFAFALTAACFGALVTAVLGVVAVAVVAPAVSLGEDPSWDLPFLGAVLAGAVLAPPVLGRLRLRELARRGARSRSAGRTTRGVDLARCACWNAAALRGEVARRYATSHLHADGPVPDAVDGLPTSAPPEIRTCPDSGLRWLLVRTPEEPGGLLVRGTARPPSPDTADPIPSGGGYL